jgi:hypothetical protein
MHRWQDIDPAELARPEREPESTCLHCERRIVLRAGLWIDPAAGYDDEYGDGIWRETCDEHDTFTAEHEPQARPEHVPGRWWTHPLVVVSVLFWAAVTAGVYFGMIR